jgi:pimeloyl-ACP methyl ester carboxylesterase
VVQPFTIAVPQAELDDLRLRLARTRWPDSGAGGWRDGTDLAYLRDVVAYWRDTYDWRRAESRLNELPQVRVDCGALGIHALHIRGMGPSPLPLVITHGWPGSVVEMLKIAPRLAEPTAYGGNAIDAFDLVIPSLPGYGFSDRPQSGGTEPRVIARMWLELMSALGYERFGAQGGDWGAAVSVELALAAPRRLAGVHLNLMPRWYLPSPHVRRQPRRTRLLRRSRSLGCYRGCVRGRAQHEAAVVGIRTQRFTGRARGLDSREVSYLE